ncbi:hypothetical protein Tco_1453771 [Tanacetum coccineum]
MRIEPTKTQKEATYQVVLDTLKLSPYYKAFLVTVDVPEIYMHQFWFTISKIKDSSSYQFKLDNRINHGEPLLLSSTNVFLGKLQNDSVLGVLKFVSKYEDRQVYGKTIPNIMLSKEIMETTAYKTYLAFATTKAIHKKARKRTKDATTIMKESSLTADDM